MKSAVPWSLAVVFGIAALASYSELSRIRTKYTELSRSSDFRKMEIDVQLRASKKPIVVFGDSITAYSNLPSEVCGHSLVKAGIGGAQAFQLIDFARNVSKEHSPYLSIIAVGMNDMRSGNQGFAADYNALLSVISGPKATVSITQARGFDPVSFNDAIKDMAQSFDAVTFDVRDIAPGPDGVHLDASGNKMWTERIVSSIRKALEC